MMNKKKRKEKKRKKKKVKYRKAKRDGTIHINHFSDIFFLSDETSYCHCVSHIWYDIPSLYRELHTRSYPPYLPRRRPHFIPPHPRQLPLYLHGPVLLSGQTSETRRRSRFAQDGRAGGRGEETRDGIKKSLTRTRRQRDRCFNAFNRACAQKDRHTRAHTHARHNAKAGIDPSILRTTATTKT